MNIMNIMWVVLVLCIIVYLVFLAGYMKFAKQLDSLIVILKDNDPDRYIDEVTKLLDGKKSQWSVNIGKLNLAIAYEAKRNFKTALELLDQLNPSFLTMANRMVYYINRAYCLFYLDKPEEACALMDSKSSHLKTQTGFEEHRAKLAILSVFYNLHNNNKKAAREDYARYRSIWYDSGYSRDFDYLQKKIL